MAFLNVLLAPFRWIGWMVLPMFAGRAVVASDGASGGGRGRVVLKWVLHAFVLVLILTGLWFLGWRLKLDRHIRVSSLWLREAWLPLLFLLFYILCWMGRSLWQLLSPDQVAADHPEIDRAWQEGLAGLVEAGVGLTEAPLFLVLGRPAGSEKSLFSAGGMRLAVKQVPRRLDAPLALSANADAVFVTAAGASLLGRYASLLHGLSDGAEARDDVGGSGTAAVATSAAPAATPSALPDLANVPGFESISLSGSSAAVAVAERPVAAPARAVENLSVERWRTLLLRDTEEVERLVGCLRHLCTLIGRDRRPFTPINGILLVIPSAAGASDAAARELASLCQRRPGSDPRRPPGGVSHRRVGLRFGAGSGILRFSLILSRRSA